MTISREYPSERTIGELFEEQVQERAEAIAIEEGAGQLSYGELDRRSNQLARYLRSLGVEQETPVAVCLERGTELVVGLLGILKAGGVYVPLDPSYPASRLEWMLEDSGAQVLLTEESLKESLPVGVGIERVIREQAREAIEQQGTESLEAEGNGRSLGYVIYTSGSTGTPKGVCVEQRSITRLVKGADYVQVNAQDVVGQASNASFDAATFEIWGALLNGARLTIIPREESLSPRGLVRELEEKGVTILFLTTALFNAVVREKADGFGKLRCLLFGGDRSQFERHL